MTEAETVATGTSRPRNRAARSATSGRTFLTLMTADSDVQTGAEAGDQMPPSSSSADRSSRFFAASRKRATIGFWRLVMAGTQEE